MVWEVIAGGAGQLAGDLLDYRASQQDRQANVAMTEADRRWRAEQAQLGRDFSQGQMMMSMNESVQRRVADAQKAGISPLAALGVPGAGMPGSPAVPGSGIGATGSASGNRSRLFANLARTLSEIGMREQAKQAQEKTKYMKARTNAVNQQVAAARLAYWERRLKLLGRTASAAATIQRQKGDPRFTGQAYEGMPKMGRYVLGYDNRDPDHRLGLGDAYFTHPDLAEALEGFWPGVHGAWGTVQTWADAAGKMIGKALHEATQAFPLRS